MPNLFFDKDIAKQFTISMGIKSLFAATIENKELPEPLEIT
jgi:hypothetical protein